MKSNRCRATLLRALIGGCTGTMTAYQGFGVLHYVIFDAETIRRGATLDWNPIILLAVVCCGASVGAILGAFYGAMEIRGPTKHVGLSVLMGIAIVAIMGVVSTQDYPSKLSEGHQLVWLIYGVPIGAVMGGIVGGIYSYFNSTRTARRDTASSVQESSEKEFAPSAPLAQPPTPPAR